jgi:hypothetical protein
VTGKERLGLVFLEPHGVVLDEIERS